jgi:CRISPR-associated protein Cst2
MTHQNIFLSILTQAMPTSNYRGEGDGNRTNIQKITTPDGEVRALVSADSMRNALREALAKRGLPMNRSRVHDQEQLCVTFVSPPDPDKYADDFLFGYMTTSGAVKDKATNALTLLSGHPPKRTSLLRMNMAVATTPFHGDTTLHQAPMQIGAVTNAAKKAPPKGQKAGPPAPEGESEKKEVAPKHSSSILLRECSYTSFQFVAAIPLGDVAALTPAQREWLAELVRALGEMHDVAGGHARSYYDFSPRALAARVTPRPTPGFKLMGFNEDGSWAGSITGTPEGLPAQGMFYYNVPGQESQPLDSLLESIIKAAGLG